MPTTKSRRKSAKQAERELWQDFANNLADGMHAGGPVFVCGRGPGKLGCVAGVRDTYSYYELRTHPRHGDMLLATDRQTWGAWYAGGAAPRVLVLEDVISGRDPREYVTIRTFAPGFYRVPRDRPDVDPPSLLYETWVEATNWDSANGLTWPRPVFDVPRIRSYATRDEAENGHISVFCQVTDDFDPERGDLTRLYGALVTARCFPALYPLDWVAVTGRPA